MSNDPLGLFQKPQPQPAKEPGFSSFLQNVALISVVAICLVLFWDQYGRSFFQRGGDDDRQEQVEPAPAATGYVIFVHERNPVEPWQADILDAAGTWTSTVQGLEFRSVDDDDPSKPVQDIIAAAKAKGFSPPFAVHKTLDGNLRKFIAFPRSLDDLKKVVK